MSLRGYCRTLSARIDCRPAMRMTRLTTIARTGRFTNRSVSLILTVLWLGSALVGRLNFVVYENRRTVAKLEHTGADDLFASLKARENCDLIATRRPELDELLAHAAIGLALLVLEVRDDEYRIAIWRIADGGTRKSYNRTTRAQENLRLNEHTGSQRALRVGQRGLKLNVSGRFVHDRVDGRNASRVLDPRQIAGCDANVVAGMHLARVLLRHAEIHINRIQRLQRNNCVTSRKVLPQVDLADAKDPRKRRPNRLSRDCGLDLSDLCLRLFLLSRRPVVVRSGNRAVLYQALETLEVETGKIALGLDRSELGLLLPCVELDEHVALMKRPSGFKRDAIDNARQVGAYGNALNGSYCPNGTQGRRPSLHRCHDSRDSFGRRLKGCSLPHGLLNLPELHQTQCRDKRCSHDQHQDHSFQHQALSSLMGPLWCKWSASGKAIEFVREGLGRTTHHSRAFVISRNVSRILVQKETIGGLHVAVGFMPAFKHN